MQQMKIDRPAYERLLYWIRERHNIHLNRLRGQEKPWTSDPILQKNFFTTPYREYDKTTKWVRHFIRDPNYSDPRVILAVIIARWFNYIPTLDILLGTHGSTNLFLDWDPDEAKSRLRGNTENQKTYKGGKYGTKTFTGAYTVPASPNKIFTGAFNISASGSTKSKIDRVIDDYIGPMYQDRDMIADVMTTQASSLQKATKYLMTYQGMGGTGFMSYEVICDLRFTYVLENAPDINTWCSIGPGAARGLQRLLGNCPLNTIRWKPKAPGNWREMVKWLLENLNKDLGTSNKNAYEVDDPLAAKKMPRFEMREVEHCLCEYDKYERLRTDGGHSKRTYPGIA